MRRYLMLLPLLVRLHIKAEMEYRGAFLLDRLAQIIAYGSAFGSIWLIVHRFSSIGGWGWPDLALLLSFQLLSYSFGAALSFVQFRDLEDQVRLGTFDTLLVKPVSPWAYQVFSGFNIGYAGHVVLAVGLLIWSVAQIGVSWTAGSVLYLLASIVSAAMVTGAVLTMIGVHALIFVRSRHLYGIYFGVWELTRYPLSIFPGVVQVLMLTVLPLGFASFVPIAFLLGKPIPIFGAWAGVAAPLVGPLLVGLAAVHWRFATSRYQGAGG
jgi:ABC-2 type transport system permease protein